MPRLPWWVPLALAVWLVPYAIPTWSQPRLQTSPDTVAPGTVPLLPRVSPTPPPEEQGQTSTGGTGQRNERIQQLVRLAMSPGTATSPGNGGAKRPPTPRPAAEGSLGAMTPGQASWLLGLIYLHGQGVPLNTPQAERWFRQAWSQQERLASAGLAWCALEGCAGPANPTQARQWIQVLRTPQPGRAHYLEWLLARKLAPIEALSTARSRAPQEWDALLRKAVALGDAQAQAAWGRQLFAQDRFAESLAQFTLAAAHSPAAARNVELVKARMTLEAGMGSGASPPARPVLDADAVYLQARRLHRGEGVPANYTEAIRLYGLADRLGQREARKMLSLIYSRPLPSGEVDIGWMRQLADLDISLPSPRMGPSSHALVLHEDLTPLMDWLPMTWRR